MISSQSKTNKDKAQIAELLEKLHFHQTIQEVTNRVHAAKDIKEIIVDLKDDILSLFNAHSLTNYVANQKQNEIYSMFLTGSKLKEIRLPINNKSIAGYIANNKKVLNITDAYDNQELKGIDSKLNLDRSWDKKSGIRTTQVLAAPILYENNMMGVIVKLVWVLPLIVKISSRISPMSWELPFTINNGQPKGEKQDLTTL